MIVVSWERKSEICVEQVCEYMTGRGGELWHETHERSMKMINEGGGLLSSPVTKRTLCHVRERV